MPVTTQITGTVVLPDGSAPLNGFIHFTPLAWDGPADGGVKAPAARTFPLGPAGGLVDVGLVPTTASMRQMPYRVEISHYNPATLAVERTDLGLISVPEVAEGDSVSIRSLLSDPGVIPTAPDVLAQVTAKAIEVDADRAAAQVARTAAEASAISAAAYANGYLTPEAYGATGGSDDRSALVAWLDALAATGKTGWIGRDFRFSAPITHAGAVKIRGPFSDSARLIYTGPGDGLELTGAVDIDGVVVDGNLPIIAIPTATSETGCLLGIHGPMTGTPGYLSGVRIGRVRVQNTRRRCALAMVNLSGLRADKIEASCTYGNAFHFAGIRSSKIRSYAFDRVGNLAAESSRLGAGIAFYAEADALKQPANWYVAAGIQPTDDVHFGSGQGSRTTDTSIYLHDSYGSGVKNVRFGHYQGYLLGKDGVKFRGGASNCSMSSCQLRKVGLRFAVIEDAGSDDNRILNVDGEQAGYDVIGEWLDGAPGTRNFTSAANGLNQTLNQTPGGVRMSGVQRSRMTGSVRAVRDAPHDGAEGNAVNFRSCVDCEMDIVADDADGLVRIGALTRCVLVADATNMGRNLSNTTAAVYCDDAADQSSNNVLRVISRERSGSAVLAYACRINGTGSGWDVDVKFGGPHLLTSGIVTRADSASFASYSGGRQVEYFRGAIAFDASALAVVTHNYGFAPSVQVITEGTLFYEVDVYANDNTTTTFRLRQADDSTANSSSDLVPSVTRTVCYTLAKYRLAAGYPY